MNVNYNEVIRGNEICTRGGNKGCKDGTIYKGDIL